MSTMKTERGAALVEAALILPLFFALVLGMISFGDAYFTRISIEDAVRDGARFGSSMETFNRDTVKQRVVGLSGGELETADVCAELVTLPDTANACGVADPAASPGSPAGSVVKVSAKTTADIEVIFFSRTTTLSAEAAAKSERA